MESNVLNPQNGNGVGITDTVTSVDLNADFQEYLNSLGTNRPLIDKSDKLYIEKVYSMSPESPSNNVSFISKKVIKKTDTLIEDLFTTSFGVNIGILTERESSDEPIPKIVTNLVNYIAKHGLEQQGIYRLSASGANGF
jgi:hypothetical protein